MAIDWLKNTAKQLVDQIGKTPATVDVEPEPPPPANLPPPAKPNAAQQLDAFSTLFRTAVPLSMLLCGALLSGCTELIGPWAALGYALLALAPVVYWLQRIEQRLAELIEVESKKR
ncbi:MAG: hypothetical protein ACRDD1_17425 [Planctomycetia bacterium]